MSAAKITVVIPSLDQGQFLNEAIASVFAQGLPLEVFVMDGGSGDESPAIIERWAPRLAGWRCAADDGQAAAINEGIARGSAPFVCWLNSDDFFYPDGLGSLLRCLEGQTAQQWVFGRCWTVSAKGNRLFPYLTLPFAPGLFANFCTIAQPATLMTRTAWDRMGGLDENMHMAFDYDLWWRLYDQFGRPAHCRQFTAATRMHKDSKTANLTELHYRESMHVVERHRVRLPLKWRVALPLMKLLRNITK